jgi:hypothetical protein
MAIAAVIVVAWKRDDAARSRWMGIAGGLSASAAAVAELAQLHVAWQGQELGYALRLDLAQSEWETGWVRLTSHLASAELEERYRAFGTILQELRDRRTRTAGSMPGLQC